VCPRRRTVRELGSRAADDTEECLPVTAESDVEQGPLDRNEVFKIVRANLADILEIEPSSITEGQSFVDDLDADSLALIELVEALEEDLSERSVGFRIEDEDLVDLKTVRDAVDYVYDRVREA
jgi:acyl carrier protein